MTTDALNSHAMRFATVNNQQIQWKLLKNCSVSPRQLGWFYASLCVVSLGIALMFWLQGVKLITPFAFAELIAVGAALLVYARHATDGERLMLEGNELVVEQSYAGRISQAVFHRQRVRVEPHIHDRSLIELSGQGLKGQAKVQIGRHVRPELRPELARELRMALRAA